MAVTKIDLASQATGVMPAGSIPNPSASTLGGVQSIAAASTKFLTAISTSGVPANGQPAFTDISGTAAAGQLPVATGAAFGAVKPDGSTITISAGVITAAGAPNFAESETPTGTIGGANATFGLAHTPVASSLKLYLNGVRQISGAGNDYTLSTATITMLNVPVTGDTLVADYRF